MPFKKFRSVEEMDDARRDLWCDQPDQTCFKRIAELWERSARLCPRKFPKGVVKYRTIEAAQADRERWINKNIGRLREERLRLRAP